jgi:hypothetical protein
VDNLQNLKNGVDSEWHFLQLFRMPLFLLIIAWQYYLWTAGATKPITPIPIFKAGHQHLAGTLARCMNKIIITDINADMGKRLAADIKENQRVAWMELAESGASWL